MPNKAPQNYRPRAERDREYLVVEVRGNSLHPCVGRFIRVSEVLDPQSVPYGYVAVKGFCNGLSGEQSLACGAKLRNLKNRPCVCGVFPFPHKRGARCQGDG